MHLLKARDVVAAELLGAVLESGRAAEGEQPLERRLEIVAPPHGEVVALAKQRHEAEAELARHGLDREPGIGLARGDRERDVGLAARRRRQQLEPRRLEARPCACR